MLYMSRRSNAAYSSATPTSFQSTEHLFSMERLLPASNIDKSIIECVFLWFTKEPRCRVNRPINAALKATLLRGPS